MKRIENGRTVPRPLVVRGNLQLGVEVSMWEVELVALAVRSGAVQDRPRVAGKRGRHARE
jgi:hypothetical protein